MATDPVCGMYVPETAHALQTRSGPATYFFCSRNCQLTFQAPDREIRRLRIYTMASFAVGLVILVLSFQALRGQVFGLFGQAPWDDPTANRAFLVLATPVQFIAGFRFYQGFFHALKARAANMDTLIALGTTTAYGYSALVALAPGRFGNATYFDTSVLIIAFILLGKTLEHGMKRRASQALRALVSLQPRVARVFKGAAEVEFPIEKVLPGDHLLVRPGERVPTDARILEGEADLDESLVTGESVPVHKKPGDPVVGGSLNTNGALRIEALRVGANTMLAQIAQLVEQAQAGKAPIQRLVDAVSAKFVPAVLLVAVLSAALWYTVGGAPFDRAALVFVAVVIIACPCALGLATPAALLVGVGRGAQHGLLVKDTAQFERLARVNLVLWDKTGTLTAGRPELVDVVPTPGPSRDEVLRVAAAVEAGSEHPLGQAVVRAARAQGIQPEGVTEFVAVAGRGVVGKLHDQKIVAGTAEWLKENVIDPTPLEPERARLEAEGKTVILLARGTSPLGLLALADTLKPGAAEAIARLQHLKVESGLVSGDNARTAQAIARQAGIRLVHAPVLPAQKSQILESQKREGHAVAMVGDGINDAPALAAADVGIALGSGTDVAREAGGLVLVKNDPRDVANAVQLSRRTVAKIRQNLFWAFLYNVALIPVAAFGLLDPILAGAAMGLSSVTVVGNSLSLRRFRPKLATHGGIQTRTVPGAPHGAGLAQRMMTAKPAPPAEKEGIVHDPVCHMRVDPATASYKHEYRGATYYFCSRSCHGAFVAHPQDFVP